MGLGVGGLVLRIRGFWTFGFRIFRLGFRIFGFRILRFGTFGFRIFGFGV